MTCHEMLACYREAIVLYHETLDHEVLGLARRWEALLFRRYGLTVEMAQ